MPYGVFDISANIGCVSVGIDNDTAQLDIWHTTRVWPTAYEDQIQRAYDIGWKGELHEVFDPSEVEGSWE